MKQYVFVYEHITLGGTQTLIYRMAKWLRENENCDVLVICKYSKESSIESSLINNGITIKYVLQLNHKSIYNCIEEIEKYDSIDFIVFHLDKMFDVEKVCCRIEKYNNTYVNYLFYVVHPYNTLIGRRLKSVILKKIIKTYYKIILVHYINSRKIIFMDEDTIANTELYYGIKIDQNTIFRLPINLNKFNHLKVHERIGTQVFNILTISRAEFPFKGYIIGLIDDYVNLCSRYNNITLTIVSQGPDIEEIKKKISDCSSLVKGDIMLVQGVPYEKIDNYIQMASIYVGMGTSILDASNYGIPSITAHPYTYENISSGFFFERPNILSSSETRIPTIDLIELTINMKKDKYMDICQKSYKALRDFYSIDDIMKNFIRYRNINNGTCKIRILSKVNSLFFQLISIKKLCKSFFKR